MRTRFFRPIGTMLSLLLLIAVPAQASPIKFADVVNVMGDLQNGGQFQRLRLRATAQEPSSSGATGTVSTKSTASLAAAAGSDTVAPIATGTEVVAPSLVSGTEVAPQQ